MSARPPLPDDASSCVSFCASCVFSCVLRGCEDLSGSTPALPLQKERAVRGVHQTVAGEDLKNLTSLPNPNLSTLLGVILTTAPLRSFPPVAS